MAGFHKSHSQQRADLHGSSTSRVTPKHMSGGHRTLGSIARPASPPSHADRDWHEPHDRRVQEHGQHHSHSRTRDAWMDRWDDEPASQSSWRDRQTSAWPGDASGNWPLATAPQRAVRRRRAHLWQVGLLVTACVVVVATLGATYLRWHLTSTASHQPAQVVRQPAPPVITLFSPSGTTTQQSGGSTASSPTQPLPNTSTAAPTQYLPPDKPNNYELSLIAAIGTPEKTIVVSRFSQTIHVYLNGTFIAGSYTITGRPQLPTPTGVYQIYLKVAPAVLYSPWPPSSPYYYPPEPVNYTMEFRAGGFLIHDAPWHHVWGPGMNDWHFDPVANEWQWGTHGCVSAPTPFIQWLYNWSPEGTTVIIY